MMRTRTITVAALCLLMLMVALAGCGGEGKSDGGSGSAGGGGKSAYDVTGTFHRVEGDVAFTITFSRDGSFEGNAWGDHRERKSGTYRLSEQGPGPRVELTFGDGERETWSAIVAEDRIEAVVNPEGEQYTRKP